MFAINYSFSICYKFILSVSSTLQQPVLCFLSINNALEVSRGSRLPDMFSPGIQKILFGLSFSLKTCLTESVLHQTYGTRNRNIRSILSMRNRFVLGLALTVLSGLTSMEASAADQTLKAPPESASKKAILQQNSGSSSD